MPKFVFQLRAVLRQREGIERLKQLALAAIEQERRTLEHEIRACHDQLSQERAELREELRATGGQGVDLTGVRRQMSASFRIVSRAQQAALKLAGVHKRLDAARAELLEATKARKAIERLRERRYEEWRTEQNRLEAAAIDEISVIRHARSQQELSEHTTQGA